MLTRLYRILLHLYPADHQALFGREMITVFERRLNDALQKPTADRAVFLMREAMGLISGALWEHRRTLNATQEPWFWSMGAPVTTLVVFYLCVRVSIATDIHGFFFPGTWIGVAVFAGYAAWRFGREQRWMRTAALALGCIVLIPAAARITEDAWARFLLHHETRLEYQLPGLDVVIDPQGHLPQFAARGITFSSTTVLSNGTVMAMSNHTQGRTPPYCLIGALLTMAIALCSRRTYSR